MIGCLLTKGYGPDNYQFHFPLAWLIIHCVNIRGLDLNLLLVFQALCREGSATRAAARMGVTQPALSNALGRLRVALGDPLFLRHGRALTPTPRALALAPVVQRCLEELDGALFSAKPFSPAQAEGTIRLALSDYWHFALLPELLATLEVEAPKVQLVVSDVGEASVSQGLSAGAVDVAFYLAGQHRDQLHSEPLVEDTYVVVVRNEHPLAGARFRLETFAMCRHVIVSPPGPWVQKMSLALANAQLTLHSAIENTRLQVAFEIVARTNHVAVVPRRIALQSRARWPLKVMPLPFEAEGFALSLYWHDRTHSDPLHRWFRKRLGRLARAVYLAPKSQL